MLHRCRRIIEIAQTGIDRGIFRDDSEVREILDAIMMETRETLMYQRQHQSTGGGGGPRVRVRHMQ